MTIDSSSPPAHLHADPSGLASLFRTLGNLKRIRRTGWVDRGVPTDDVESVADHSFLTAIVAWVVASDNSDLDADRVLKRAGGRATYFAGDIAYNLWKSERGFDRVLTRRYPHDLPLGQLL